jgi:hypothetical protein
LKNPTKVTTSARHDATRKYRLFRLSGLSESAAIIYRKTWVRMLFTNMNRLTVELTRARDSDNLKKKRDAAKRAIAPRVQRIVRLRLSLELVPCLINSSLWIGFQNHEPARVIKYDLEPPQNIIANISVKFSISQHAIRR